MVYLLWRVIMHRFTKFICWTKMQIINSVRFLCIVKVMYRIVHLCYPAPPQQLLITPYPTPQQLLITPPHTSTTVDNPHPTPQQLVITPTTPQQLLIRDCFVSSKMNNREFVVCQFCGFTCNFYFYIWYYWYIDLFKLFQFLIIMQTPLSPQQYMYMYCHLRHWWHVHVHVFINYMLQIWFLELSQTKTLEIDNMFYSETNIFVPKKITVTLLL